jgi:hypothetical protein
MDNALIKDLRRSLKEAWELIILMEEGATIPLQRLAKARDEFINVMLATERRHGDEDC